MAFVLPRIKHWFSMSNTLNTNNIWRHIVSVKWLSVDVVPFDWVHTLYSLLFVYPCWQKQRNKNSEYAAELADMCLLMLSRFKWKRNMCEDLQMNKGESTCTNDLVLLPSSNFKLIPGGTSIKDKEIRNHTKETSKVDTHRLQVTALAFRSPSVSHHWNAAKYRGALKSSSIRASHSGQMFVMSVAPE